jgi:hypothetical protein
MGVELVSGVAEAVAGEEDMGKLYVSCSPGHHGHDHGCGEIQLTDGANFCFWSSPLHTDNDAGRSWRRPRLLSFREK